MFRKLSTGSLTLAAVAALGLGAVSLSGAAQAGMHAKAPVVGGAAMLPSRNIVENAARSSVHTTLVAAVKAAGLVDTLTSPGPFTVFAPTNAAFAKLPAGTVDTLLKPENKDTLTKVLTYHVVAGRVLSTDLVKLIRAGGGKAEFATVQGQKLTARLMGKHIVITDASGGKTMVTQANVLQSNGVIHVTNGVFLPR
jgi:uncharacterized surface protein with fasciclin (FAS1) repeats